MSTMAGHQEEMLRLNIPGCSGNFKESLTDTVLAIFDMPLMTMELFCERVVQLDRTLLVPVVRHCSKPS